MQLRHGMHVEITFRNVRESAGIASLVHRKAEQLGRVCGHLQRCRVAIEQPHHRHRTGNRTRVRIDLTVPPGHELVVVREPQETAEGQPLGTTVGRAFAAARRELTKLVGHQRGEDRHGRRRFERDTLGY